MQPRSPVVRSSGERWSAPYASRPDESRGRLCPEAASPTRGAFQRDRDRIIHSTAFRRLKHKTQVFVFHEGDHFRTRLTHTIEVSQIARAISRSLGLDEDLAEALALSHDLGHTPFGHTGEDVLASLMSEWGGFDHNAQALRIVTRLERRYAAFDGLNLSWETLEGLVKHNGPLLDPSGRPGARGKVPGAILEYDAQQSLDLTLFAAGEAQAAAVADDIAYNAHDIDDGLRSGLFAIEDLRVVPFLRQLLDEVDGLHPSLEPSRRIHELTRRVITRLVEDVLDESGARLDRLAPAIADDIRRAGAATIGFSPAMAASEAELKSFLFAHLYRHPRLMAVRAQAETVMRGLFARLSEEPSLMPHEWSFGLVGLDQQRLARRVADFIAGMTDRYALSEHRRLFGVAPDLRVS